MTTKTFCWALASGFALVGLSACSGAENGQALETGASVPEVAAAQANLGGDHHDPARFVAHFDKNGDVPLRPATTFEAYLRSRRFPLRDYSFSG